MKRVLAIALLILSMSNLVVNADDIVNEEKIIVSPKYQQINTFAKSFDMQAGGKTAYYAYLSSSVTNDVRLYGFIQQYKNGNWTRVHSISNLSSSGYAILSGSYNVPKGYDYRFKIYGYAYVDGIMAESVTWISEIESY